MTIWTSVWYVQHQTLVKIYNNWGHHFETRQIQYCDQSSDLVSLNPKRYHICSILVVVLFCKIMKNGTLAIFVKKIKDNKQHYKFYLAWFRTQFL